MLKWAHLPECQSPPENWTVAPFTKLAEVVAGQSPPSETYNEEGLGLPFLQGNADFGDKYPVPKAWCTAPQKVAIKDDILISIRAPVGEINLADQDYAIGRGLAALRASSIESNFLYQAIQRWRGCLQRVAQGSTFDAVTARHFAQLYVAVPSSEEQKAIAQILDTADTAIEQTRESINRIQKLRRSLMQELLPPWVGFRRIDFADSSVEKIVLAHEVAEICNGTTPSRVEGRYWRNGKIPWLATGKVHDRTIKKAIEFVTEAALRECSIKLLPPGTILIGMIGQGRTRGMTAYLDLEACINQNFGAFVPKENLFGKWLFHYFTYHYSRIREIGGGTNQGALNCYILKRIRIPLPSIETQKKVAVILDQVDSLEQAQTCVLQGREKLKKALMYDLLTGKKRVNPDKLISSNANNFL